jgi:hypothetical protein
VREKSDFGFRSWQVARDYLILKARSGVRAIAEGLVLRLAASAEADNGPACQAELLSQWIEDLEIALDSY